MRHGVSYEHILPILLYAVPLLAYSPALASPAIAGPVQATVLRVLDGDTFEARAAIWPDIEVTAAVRIAGIDAPELHAACARERELAAAAHALLADALPAGAAVRLTRIAHDKYAGRVVAEAWLADGRATAPLLLATGLAAAYGRAPRLMRELTVAQRGASGDHRVDLPARPPQK
jgi:micrococcal nuclease